ncbi:unnamed protein product [Cyclocybe aegerita]|uniref:Uncharacterized protein n=1 Tax=Cyclocybe aegerita TaxID=1973307 RepID=A0A8S0W5W1_CYCAE|nr:unnamed protein product [Cyclocybe aegerita]
MKKGLTDHEIRCLGSKFDLNIREEASYVLWYIWREKRAAYANLQACIAVLLEDEDLYLALKAAHAKGTYESIRQWKRIAAESCVTRGSGMDIGIKGLLAELEPAVMKLVAGEITLPAWTPIDDKLDPEIISHLTSLRIPCLKGKPNLLLHDLGSFTREPLLERRLKNIFMPNNHTFLVNTSGSGKTRLLLEGLCENWGFYFTSLVDSSLLGSSDIQNSIQTHVPDSDKFRRILPPAGSAGYGSALKANRDIASRIFRQTFLARLMVFNLFAEIMNRHAESNKKVVVDSRVYKTRWLLLQLRPSLVHPQVWDIFDELSSKLSSASDAFINTMTKTLLIEVRSICSRVDNLNDVQMPTSDVVQTPLFCVLDEAQHAATQHNSSFRSDHNGAHRPILREIVKAWEGQSFGQGVFMVVAGTGISKDVVDQAMASAIMKDSRYRWCSDTGAFDRKEGGDFWRESGIGYTEAELLQNGFKRPHGLLNAYVEHFTNFKITDAVSLVASESLDALPVLSQYKLDFSKLKKNGDMLTTIHQLTSHYLMRSVLPITLGKDEATYVEYGFARFVDSETKTVAVDEPLVLLAATHWINANVRTTYKSFAKQIQVHEPASNGFENYVGFCLDMIFSYRRRLSDIFTFHGDVPAWGNLDAELVGLHRTSLDRIETSTVRHFLFSGPSVTLGANAKSPEETSEWLHHQSPTPMCFPHISMGPDLIFVLRLSDGTMIWVVLQAKYSLGKNGKLSRLSLRQAMRSITPSTFFLDKVFMPPLRLRYRFADMIMIMQDDRPFSPASHPNLVKETNQKLLSLPYRRNDAGRYSLLRVVASFPAETHLKRCLEEDPDNEGHPIASLNMTLVKQVTRKLSPIDFLQGLEDPLQNTGKRKRGCSEPLRRRSKKIKLN